ncbi:hypothetical protein BC629DRAFT_555747 [Irpex lacteus]|nr:hypothetical protein BC629DRAFT_555747 [Irpex lacteus]
MDLRWCRTRIGLCYLVYRDALWPVMFARLFPTLCAILFFLGIHAASAASIGHLQTRDLSSLTDWAKGALKDLFESDDDHFDAAISGYLGSTTKIILIDGEELTRQQYIDRLHNSRSTFSSAVVNWVSAVELEATEGDASSGMVGIFFTVDITDLTTGSTTPTETATCSFNMQYVTPVFICLEH